MSAAQNGSVGTIGMGAEHDEDVPLGRCSGPLPGERAALFVVRADEG